MSRTKVEGVDYSPEGIEALRDALIELRGGAFKAWPEGIDATLVLSHAIAVLADYKEMREEEDHGWLCTQCGQTVIPREISTIVDGLVLVECPKCYHQREFRVEEAPTDGEHKAQWNRGDIRITAHWKDEPSNTNVTQQEFPPVTPIDLGDDCDGDIAGYDGAVTSDPSEGR